MPYAGSSKQDVERCANKIYSMKSMFWMIALDFKYFRLTLPNLVFFLWKTFNDS